MRAFFQTLGCLVLAGCCVAVAWGVWYVGRALVASWSGGGDATTNGAHAWPSSATAPPLEAMVDGATARVNSKGDGMACFLTEKAMDDFVDATVNKDRYGAMEALQQAVLLQQGTRVRAIQHKGFLFDKMRIRLDDGDDAGTACWVPSDAGVFKDVQNP